MSDLQARIGRKVTQLYPNLTWKRPPPSPSKNTLKSSQIQAHQSDEKDDDEASNASSSQKTQPSLLRRMGLSSDNQPKEAAGIQPSLLSRVDKTPQPSSSSVCNAFFFLLFASYPI
jgi:hypothetical protein